MMIEDQDTPSAITDLDAEYDILGELGRGGMAVVYLARDRQLGREVAIKVIRAQYVDDEEAMTRFAREARTVAQLNHPGIVAIHAVKRLADGSLALVMQHIRGHTLKQEIRQQGPLPIERVEQVLRDVGEALECAHERGIVHRDVKPENILLEDASGRALLFDFGIARSADNRTHLTLTGMALGTPAYMSPEQIDGIEVDGRSDLYSLGLVGWEMLTGKRPWEGEGLYSVIFKQKNEQLPSLDSIRPDSPERMRIAIEGALQKNRDLRWSSAANMLSELDADRSSGRRERSRAAKEQRERVVAALAEARALQSASAPPDAKTIRYRREEGDPVPLAPQPSRPRRFMHIGAAVAALLLFSGSAAIIAAINERSPTKRAEPTAASDTRTTAGAGDAVPAVVPASDTTIALALDSTLAVAAPPADSPIAPPSPDSAARPVEQATEPAPRNDPVQRATSAPTVPSVEPPVRLSEPPPASIPTAAAAKAAETPPSEPAPSLGVEGGVVVAGGMHSCVLTPTGEGLCWGGNERGQLGNGSTTRRTAPAPVAGDIRFGSLSAGVSHTCGLSRGGEAYCWGANESGQLGDGSASARAAPVRVTGSRRFARLWAGTSHTCGVSAGGEAFCWGGNSNGQLGDGSRTNRPTPVRVRVDARVGNMAVGWKHTCALTRDGTAFCWGQNASGQLGDGSTADRAAPEPLAGNERFQRLAAGSAHTCGVTRGGDVLCWGRNTYGQLGDGSTADRTSPTATQSTSKFNGITAGSTHTCALDRAGTAFCWGRNSYGQLGDGSTTDRAVPVKVAGGYIFSSLHASGAHTCGTTPQGERFCWGYNVEGQLGDGTREHRARPVRVGT